MKKIVFSLALFLLILSCPPAHAETSAGKLVLDWSYAPSSMINRMYVDDLNNDGVLELIVSSKEGVLYDLGDKTKAGHVYWQNTLKGDIRGVKVTDFNGDGRKEVLAGTDQTAENLGVFDYLGVKEGGTREFPYTITAIDAADMDGDGKMDFVLGSTTKSVYALASLKTGEKTIWEYETAGPVYYVHVSDMNQDNLPETVALSVWREEEDEYAAVYALSSKGKLIWKYDIMDAVFRSAANPMEAFDLDSDGKEEYIVGTLKGVLVLDSAGKEVWSYEAEKYVNAVHVSRAAGSGKPVVYAGATPTVYALDSGGKLLWKKPVETTVFCIHAADLNKDGSTEVLLGMNRYVEMLSESGQLIYSLFDAGDIEGQKVASAKSIDARTIASGDLDGDGMLEVAVGYGWTETRIGTNYYLGDIRVYKPVGLMTVRGGASGQVTSTTASSKRTSTTAGRETGPSDEAAQPSGGGAQERAGGGDSSAIILVALAGVAFIGICLLAVVVYVFFWKKKT